MNQSLRRPAWGKFRSIIDFHRLEHHCADVAACFEALLRDRVLRHRFIQASGTGDICPVTASRLAVLAFLHDVGKLNCGFQFKVFDRDDLPPDPPPRAGHCGQEVFWCFQQERICEAIGLYTMFDEWGEGFEPLFLASLSHHGRPPLQPRSGDGPSALWEPFAGYDPQAAATLLGERIRAWFPDAFVHGPSLVDSAAFSHLFAGIVALADQTGSVEEFFCFEPAPDPTYMVRARERAARAVERRNLTRAVWSESTAPTRFQDLFDHPEPRPLQSAVQDAPLDQRLLILESETGSGKTEAAVLRFSALWHAGLVDGLYFAVPTRAAAKQLHGRVLHGLRNLFPAEMNVETVLAIPGYHIAGEARGRTVERPFPRLCGDRVEVPMYDLLVDSLIRARLVDGTVRGLSLPEVYAALVADRISAFPALRPHQRHSWHAFLAQLATVAIHHAGRDSMPGSAREWCTLLLKLTSEYPDHAPWKLLVDDPAQPAFMQCPAPAGLGSYRGSMMTPDDLDILVTSKNHDIKQTVARNAALEDWVFALIDLQTMAGFLGAGNYQIARMNGGFSARPCVGFAPAGGGLGAHVCCDVERMLAGRDAVMASYEDYYRTDPGLALVWLVPWDGTGSLDLRELDPYFIEICRRVRLVSMNGSVGARRAPSKAPRIQAKMAGGDVGDFWTPVRREDSKALSLSSVGFRYDRLQSLILDERMFLHPPSMMVAGQKHQRWRLVARGVAAGQGKTEGYHERSDIVFGDLTARAFGRRDRKNVLAEIAKAQLEEIEEVTKALRFGIAVAASGGRNADQLTKSNRVHANTYARRIDTVADARFFAALEDRFAAQDSVTANSCRGAFARHLIDAAWDLLQEAIETVPCPAIQRPRARARATTAFWGRLRRAKSVFSDQPEVFAAEESTDVA